VCKRERADACKQKKAAQINCKAKEVPFRDAVACDVVPGQTPELYSTS